MLKSLFRLGLLCPLGFTSCAYHWGYEENSLAHSTLAIPYIEGDVNGELTAELIKKVSQSGQFRYQTNGALTLVIKKMELSDENVGFRYDRHQHGKMKKALVPTETRVHATVEVCLIDSCSGDTLRGPTIITAFTDFDHCFYSSRHEINVFSLGQVNNIDSAREVAATPLNRTLATKIVDYLVHCW